jgi:putative heme transporter
VTATEQVPAAGPPALTGRPATGRPAAATSARRHRRRLVRAAATLAVPAAIFGLLLPRFAPYGNIWHSLGAIHWPVLVLIGAGFAVSEFATWAMITAVLPSLRLRQAAVANLGSTAVANTLPAGGAIALGVSWTMLASWGVGTAERVQFALVSAFWNVIVRVGLPVATIAVLALAGRAGPVPPAVAFTGAAVLLGTVAAAWCLLRSETSARRAGQLLGRAAAAGCRLVRRRPAAWAPGLLLESRASAANVLTTRGLRIGLAAVASHLSLWLVLLACLRASGLGQDVVGWQASLAAFALARLLSMLPVTPGGVGIVEACLTAPLAAGLGPATAGRVAAAVLVFRAVTYLLPVPLGAAAYFWWRRTRRAAAAPGRNRGPLPLGERQLRQASRC